MGAASSGARDVQSSYNVVMAEERLVGGAALQNGAVGCWLLYVVWALLWS